MQDLENIETKAPTAITPENNEKEIKKEDIDLLLDNASEGYISLATLVISRMEKLDILSPVVDPVLLSELEKKCEGLTINMQKLEEDLNILKSESEKVAELLKNKVDANEEDIKKIDLELLPRFETLVYKTGDVHKGIETLSEYYFINIQAIVDSLESNAIKKHDELSKLNIEVKEEKDNGDK